MTDAGGAERGQSVALPRETGRSFPRQVASLPLIVGFTDEFLSGVEMDSASRFDIDIAVEEIFTNFVRHNAGGRGDIEIRLRLDENAVSIALTDFDSDSFDITTEAPAVDIAAPAEKREPGGLGLHFVKKVMDGVDYSWTDRTATIRLTKNLG
jgi:anti-sigma regulatory factor (Ser/Thr protein kinase)